MGVLPHVYLQVASFSRGHVHLRSFRGWGITASNLLCVPEQGPEGGIADLAADWVPVDQDDNGSPLSNGEVSQ